MCILRANWTRVCDVRLRACAFSPHFGICTLLLCAASRLYTRVFRRGCARNRWCSVINSNTLYMCVLVLRFSSFFFSSFTRYNSFCCLIHLYLSHRSLHRWGPSTVTTITMIDKVRRGVNINLLISRVFLCPTLESVQPSVGSSACTVCLRSDVILSLFSGVYTMSAR